MRRTTMSVRLSSILLVGAALNALASAQTTPTAFFDLGGAPKLSRSGVVRDAGDVNNDGYPDVVVGAPEEDGRQGAARIFSGRDGVILWKFESGWPFAQDYFGTAVSGAGDMDLDGHVDIIVGAPQSQPGSPYEGYAIIFSGKTGHLLHHIDGDSGSGGDQFGFAVAAVGDVNGDGIADAAIGAPQSFDPLGPAGYVHVISGKDGSALLKLQDWIGGSQGDWFGFSVKAAGLINGDTSPDIIVGAPGEFSETGGAVIFSGHDGSIIRRWYGQNQLDRFGHAVSGIGDADGDGIADVIVGAPGADGAFQNGGSATVFSGKTGAVLSTIAGTHTDDAFGAAVSEVGDVNNDAVPEFVVGAPASCGSGSQPGYVLVGFLSGSTFQDLYRALGDAVGDAFGASVSALGDLNHDGFDDFIVGAPCNDGDGKNAGSARVFSGRSYPASWNNYGTGFPGTSCEPSLTASSVPVICTTITLDITNCRGPDTPAMFIIGLAPGAIQNPSGGTLLVAPPWVFHPFVLPSAGARMPVKVLCDSAFCGLSIYTQVLEFDPGAGGPRQDVSSSKGMSLVLGGF